MKGTTATLEEKMSLLDLASSVTSAAASTKNGDSQLQKHNKENLSRGMYVML
jgi:hypothetical protein